MKYKKDYFGFVYIWYDKLRKKYCIGSHFGSLDDGYTSSTGYFKRAYKKRPQDFKRRILAYATVNNRKLVLELEQKYLNLIKEEELKVKYYNFTRHARGGCEKHTEESKRRMSQIKKKNFESGKYIPWNKGVPHSEIAKEKMSRSRKGKSAHNKGLPMTDAQKELISKKAKGRTAWNKGVFNPYGAENGRKGAEKMRAVAKGRKRKYNENGTWTWEYPNEKE